MVWTWKSRLKEWLIFSVVIITVQSLWNKFLACLFFSFHHLIQSEDHVSTSVLHKRTIWRCEKKYTWKSDLTWNTKYFYCQINRTVMMYFFFPWQYISCKKICCFTFYGVKYKDYSSSSSKSPRKSVEWS